MPAEAFAGLEAEGAIRFGAEFVQHRPMQPAPQPDPAHTVNRRCAVVGETPNGPGRNRHAHPLAGTYTTAVNTARSSTEAVPPHCGRDENLGNHGSQLPQLVRHEPTRQISTTAQRPMPEAL